MQKTNLKFIKKYQELNHYKFSLHLLLSRSTLILSLLFNSSLINI
jgi:hypothetical protein